MRFCGRIEFPYIIPLILVSLLIIAVLLATRECKSSNPQKDINLNVSISPDKGIEPLLVEITLDVKSSSKIKILRVDFEGDGKWDIEKSPQINIYSEKITFEYVTPQDVTNYGRDITQFYYPITFCAEAENESGNRDKKCKEVYLIPTGKPNFNLIANTCSGPPPLEVDFRIEITNKVYDKYVIRLDCDGDGEYEIQGEPYRCRFETTGLYPSRVSVLAPNRKFSVSEYIYCGKVSPGLISKYIEVLPEKIVPHKIFVIPTPEVFELSQNELLIGGRPGLITIKDKRIYDISGVFFSPFDTTETKDITEGRITTFPFNIIFMKAHGSKAFITSELGTYLLDILTKKYEKLSESRYAVLPYNTDFLAIDTIKGEIKRCIDPELQFCNVIYPQESTILIRKILYRYKNGILRTLVVHTDGSAELFQFDGQTIDKKQIPFNIGWDAVIGDNVYILENPASPKIDIFDIESGNTSEIEKPNEKILFTSVHEIEKGNLILGIVEIPCPGEEITKSCNLALYDSNRFQYLEGEGNISYFISEIEKSPSFKEIYFVNSDGFVGSLTAVKRGNSWVVGKQTKVNPIPSPPITEMTTGTTEMVVLTQKSLISFDQAGNFINSFSIEDGIMTKVEVKDEFIFLGVSDDITKGTRGEGRILILKNYDKLTEYTSDDLAQSQINCLSAAKITQGRYLLIVCANEKIKLFEFQNEVRKMCEIKLSSTPIDAKYKDDRIFVATVEKLITVDTQCRKVDEKPALVQFFQIDIDEEKGLLFSAEGDNHSFRIWDIKSGYPVEITRYQLDYAPEGDLASGISHIGNTLYVSSTHTTLFTFDISSPEKPKLLRKVYITESLGPVQRCYPYIGKEIACLVPGSKSIYFFR